MEFSSLDTINPKTLPISQLEDTPDVKDVNASILRLVEMNKNFPKYFDALMDLTNQYKISLQNGKQNAETVNGLKELTDILYPKFKDMHGQITQKLIDIITKKTNASQDKPGNSFNEAALVEEPYKLKDSMNMAMHSMNGTTRCNTIGNTSVSDSSKQYIENELPSSTKKKASPKVLGQLLRNQAKSFFNLNELDKSSISEWLAINPCCLLVGKEFFSSAIFVAIEQAYPESGNAGKDLQKKKTRLYS
jgi:hypothetical protein